MSLRIKCFITLCISIVILTTTIPILTSRLLLSTYENYEKQEVQRSIQSAIRDVDDRMGELDHILLSWSNWDDMYYYMANEYDEFEEYVLDTNHFTFAKLNAFVVLDTDKDIKYSKGFYNGKRSRLMPSLLTLIEKDRSFVDSLLKHKRGLIVLTEGPMMVVGRPIYTSRGEGEAQGWILMGRYLDSTSGIISLTNRSITPDIHNLVSSITDNGGTYITPLTNDVVAGYTILPDV